MSRRSANPRAAQAILLLLAVLVVMAGLALWILGMRSIVFRRLFTQDGGDAAVLAAARWQAAALNLCGELNLIQAYMLADDRENIAAAQALHELRLRVQLVCPVLAAHAAHTAAKTNQLEPIAGAMDYLRDCRRYIRLEGFYDDAEQDLRDLLGILTREELCAFPVSGVYENAEFHNYLLDQDFYEAVLSRNWCWFKYNSLLNTYISRKSFGPLPKVKSSPFFDLALDSLESSLDDLEVINTLSDQLVRMDHPALPDGPPLSAAETPAQRERHAQFIRPIGTQTVYPIRWTTYNPNSWGPWQAMNPGRLPIEGRLREAYDYAGGSAAVSVQSGSATWLAAAKAFGEIEGENPTEFKLVLGGFNAVRLIPVDAADVGLYSFNMAWLNHLRAHLPRYTANGTLSDTCRYCSALRRWEEAEFRHNIRLWLAEYGHTCVQPEPGNGPGGGTRYGH